MTRKWDFIENTAEDELAIKAIVDDFDSSLDGMELSTLLAEYNTLKPLVDQQWKNVHQLKKKATVNSKFVNILKLGIIELSKNPLVIKETNLLKRIAQLKEIRDNIIKNARIDLILSKAMTSYNV